MEIVFQSLKQNFIYLDIRPLLFENQHSKTKSTVLKTVHVLEHILCEKLLVHH